MSQASSQEVIITAFIDAIHPNFNYVVATTAFSSCLLTLLVVLFAFSTKESRARPVFHLNVLAICLALTLGIFSEITSGAAILDPFHPIPKDVYTATIVFGVFPPLFYDSILLCRLFALYPPAITPRITLLKIFAFPFFIKCARLIVIVRFSRHILSSFPNTVIQSLILNDIVNAATSTVALVQYATDTRFGNPYMVAEWSMQIADNLCVPCTLNDSDLSMLVGQIFCRFLPIQVPCSHFEHQTRQVHPLHFENGQPNRLPTSSYRPSGASPSNFLHSRRQLRLPSSPQYKPNPLHLCVSVICGHDASLG